MNNIKKTVIIVVAVLVLFIVGLFLGSRYGANSNWSNEVIQMAGREINQAGFDKKEELIAQDVVGGVKKALNPKIAEEQAELERLLEEYYQLKLAGLTDSEEFAKVEKEIEKVKLASYNRYTKDIDAIFDK